MIIEYYYCKHCNSEFDINQVVIRINKNNFGETYNTMLCPQCRKRLDHRIKYKCNHCGALMYEPAGTYNGHALCEHCIDSALVDDPDLRFCEQCHRIADKILIPNECLLCKFDQIDEDIHEINKTLRKMYKEEQKKVMSAGCMALAKLE